MTYSFLVASHLEAASGILSMIKAVMMIERRALLPNAWFEEFTKGISEREKLRVRFCRLQIILFVDLGAKTTTGAANSHSTLHKVPTARLRDQFW